MSRDFEHAPFRDNLTTYASTHHDLSAHQIRAHVGVACDPKANNLP